MDLICYLHPGWEPRIRPASLRRSWMDDAPESFAYRCLPLAIVNSHGWEVLSPCGFEVEWNGGTAPADVIVRVDPGTRAHEAPVPLFGAGTVTVHIQGLFRTPPGWNLYVNGPPNCGKDAIVPLAGIIETDWAPYTFTMNWQLTRTNYPVRFEENEPIAFFFPVQRGAIEAVNPQFAPMDEAPELKAAFAAWSRSRDAFQQQMRDHPPEKPADKWQKFYYRGLLPDGACPVADHKPKLRIREFANPELAGGATAAMAVPMRQSGQPAELPRAPVPRASFPHTSANTGWTIAKYEWLLETAERQRALSPEASGIFRCNGLTGEEFLDNFYAPGRPTILCGAIDDWPALGKWSPAYLRDRLGAVEVECQGRRTVNSRFELDKDGHRQLMRFDSFIDGVSEADGNDLYITAYNGAANAAAFACLGTDVGRIDAILDHGSDQTRGGAGGGKLWIGPAGTFAPMHHDLTNSLLVQITGRKRVIIAAPGETPKLYNATHVFSEIPDLTAPDIDFAAYPRLQGVRTLDITLEPGEALFIPVGWWHQVKAIDFSVSMTFTNFRWPNDRWQDDI